MTTPNQAGIIAKTAEQSIETASKKTKTLRDYVGEMSADFAKALPKVMTPDRFTRIVLTALSTTPQLAECTKASFLGAIMNAAQLGLEPNTPLGQAYLIPYKNSNKKCVECQFQIGYKGLLDLAYRSGEVTTVQAHVVYENDVFEYELGISPVLKHKPQLTDRGDMKYVYAMFKLKNGGESFVVCSKEDILKHAKRYSAAFKFGPWQTNFEEMAKKTVLKQLLKYAPIRSDFVVADEKTFIAEESVGGIALKEELYFDDETGEVLNEVPGGEQAEQNAV